LKKKILVILGSDTHEFTRLIQFLDIFLITHHFEYEFTFQLGYTKYVPKIGFVKQFFSHSELIELINKSDAVVAHGGAGVFNMCASLGKMPILVARSVALGEHRDPSQPFFCQRLEDLNLCVNLRVLSSADLINAFNYVNQRQIIINEIEMSIKLVDVVSAQLSAWGFKF
jgi:UDP-N-acetylglucosamine transferase subunit ALG13